MPGHDSAPGFGPQLPQALRLLQGVAQGVVVLDAAGRCVFANAAAARLLAWPEAAGLSGHSWRESFDPAEAERLETQAFARARAGEGWSGEVAALRHDG